MTDYTDLINALKICADFKGCNNCTYYGKGLPCVRVVMKQAASTIEELATELARLQGKLHEGECYKCGRLFIPWISTLCRDCDTEVARQALMEEMQIE